MSSAVLSRRRLVGAAAAGAALAALPALAVDGRPEKSRLTLAVGGKASL